MTKNMGGVDRVIRIVVFVVIAILVVTKELTGAWAVVLGIVGVVLLITSLIGSCPLYGPLKISTLKKKAQ